MPIKVETQITASGARLPVTTVVAGGHTLSFCGRPGAFLRRAVEDLERGGPGAAADEVRRLYPAPSDPRD